MIGLLNPAGLWALAAIPLLLGIHFFQRRRKPTRISTLFLMRPAALRSAPGGQFDRLRSSPELWWQCLAALFAALLLSRPSIGRNIPVVPVAIVIDSSASMSAFEKEARSGAAAAASEISAALGSKGEVRFSLIAAGAEPAILLRDATPGALAAALAKWSPSARGASLDRAFALAESLVENPGRLLLVTDRQILEEKEQFAFSGGFLAVGSSQSNVGVAGVSVADGRYEIFVRNYSDAPASRAYTLSFSESLSGHDAAAALGVNRGVINLEADGLGTLSGSMPSTAGWGRVVLDADRFALDDTADFTRPQRRPLHARVSLPPGLLPLADRLRRAAEIEEAAPDGPFDLEIASYDPLAPSWPDGPAIVFLLSPEKPDVLRGGAAAELHPLMADLSWDALRIAPGPAAPPGADAETLLWVGERAALFLRRAESGVSQLVFNFDLRYSNAPRLPAFVLLVHRFAETLRADKRGIERRDVACGQEIRLPRPAPGAPGRWIIRLADGRESASGRADGRRPVAFAPGTPGRFSIFLDGEPVFEGAARFNEPLEADLRNRSGGARPLSFAADDSAGGAGGGQTPFSAILEALLGLALLGSLLASWQAGRTSKRRAPSPKSP